MTVAEDVEAERATLADTLETVGPSASAGCGTWTAFDLAAHIVGADRAAGTITFCIRVVAARGVQFRPKAQLVSYAINRERRGGYPALLARVRRRSPRLLLTSAVAALTLFEVWTHHDDLNHHRERFTRQRLGDVASGAGLHLEASGYLFQWLFMAKLVERLRERVFGPAPAPTVPTAALNGLLYALSIVERKVLGLSMPFGSSLVGVLKARAT